MEEKNLPFVLEFTNGKKTFSVEVNQFPVSSQVIRELIFNKYKYEITHWLSSNDVYLESHSLTIQAKNSDETYSRKQLESTHLLNLFEVERSLKKLTEEEAKQALMHLKSVLQNHYGWSAHDVLNEVAKDNLNITVYQPSAQTQYLAKSLTGVINPLTQDVSNQSNQDLSEEDLFPVSNR